MERSTQMEAMQQMCELSPGNTNTKKKRFLKNDTTENTAALKESIFF